MRNTDYKFVETDSEKILSALIKKYEKITGHTIKPSDPDRLFISWVANAIVNERVNQNYAANQNIPSRAEGVNLDALGEWIYSLKRKAAQSAKCMVRFNISTAQETSISIPSGTRVTDKSQHLIWVTTKDALIPIGETYTDVMVQCQTAGTIGNGYTEGQICVLLDMNNILYFSSCANITESDGGAEEQDDNTYYEAMRTVPDSYSTAGAEGAYIYWAKSVSDEIKDVKAINPKLLKSKTLNVFRNADNNRFAFVGGDQIIVSSIKVYDEGFSHLMSKGSDYLVDYSDGLLTLALKPTGAVATANKISVKYEQLRAGYVYIYALMNDGTIASQTIKDAILDACSSSDVRPLTDYVTVQDPEVVTYNINCTYYISEESQKPLSEIEADVTKAINTYIEWQCAKLGRDINPDELKVLLKKAGVKRVNITSPTFTSLRSGANNDIPQIAQLGTVTVTNGGYEDE